MFGLQVLRAAGVNLPIPTLKQKTHWKHVGTAAIFCESFLGPIKSPGGGGQNTKNGQISKRRIPLVFFMYHVRIIENQAGPELFNLFLLCRDVISFSELAHPTGEIDMQPK